MTVTLLFAFSFSSLTINANAQSGFDSGYSHGCSDAKISDPDDRYINQPEKGPSFHTDEFMNGYYDGVDSCTVSPHLNSPSTSTNQFIVKVMVTNNQNYEREGEIHFSIYDTSITKILSNIVFPAHTTITKTFTFEPQEVPVGTEFNVDLYYDDRSEYKTGYNSPQSKSELIKFVLYSNSEPEIEGGSSAKEISINVGQKFIIKLKSNPSTGYGWYPVFDEKMIVLSSATYRDDKLDNDKNIVGHPGTEIFTFQAIKDGKTDIKMEYKRTFETSAIDVKSYTINIEK